MSAPLMVGIDVSTTAVKAIAWTADGTAVAEGRASYPLSNPEPRGFEQDAEDWWKGVVTALGSMSQALGEQGRDVLALCVANQRETIVLTDDAGTPLAPALVWMDGRCEAEVREAVRRRGRDFLHQVSGKPPCTTPSLYKLMYLLGRAAPELAETAPRAIDVHGFVTWRLTGRFATSRASADPTGMVDLRSGTWSPELCALAGLELGALPELLWPGERLGTLLPEIAAMTGLPEDLPIVAGAGDGQAAGLGAGVIQAGRAYLNLGTALVSGVVSDRYRTDDSFRTLYGATPGTYFCESDLKGGTLSLTWLAERLFRKRPNAALWDELERAATPLPPGSGGLFLPYLAGVMNPYWDDAATGAFVGLRADHRAEHLYRSILEGLAFEERLHLDAIADRTAPIDEIIVVGGGAASDLWCGILASVLGRVVKRSESIEATSLGAAMIAGMSCGLFDDDAHACRAMTRTGDVFEPGPNEAAYAALYQTAYRDVYPALKATMAALARHGAAQEPLK